MWSSMFSFDIPVLEKILRTILVYLLIVVIFRLVGRRSLAQSNTQDLVVMLLLSNVVQNAVIGSDNTVLGGVVGAVTLVSVNASIDYLTYRYPTLRVLFQGHSVDVVVDGRPITKELDRLTIKSGDLDHAIRMQNGNEIAEVSRAEMDPNGHLLITLQPQDRSATAGDIAALNARLDRIEELLRAG
jgi:uncharacterized membrane protein YcaP (DUF421 family)